MLDRVDKVWESRRDRNMLDATFAIQNDHVGFNWLCSLRNNEHDCPHDGIQDLHKTKDEVMMQQRIDNMVDKVYAGREADNTNVKGLDTEFNSYSSLSKLSEMWQLKTPKHENKPINGKYIKRRCNFDQKFINE